MRVADFLMAQTIWCKAFGLVDQVEVCKVASSAVTLLSWSGRCFTSLDQSWLQIVC